MVRIVKEKVYPRIKSIEIKILRSYY